ncbi:hypothetical protein [Changchengzhania lutea]|uniref:hypothetical protein n=1 Tax=Changchengzhania lutea TaxID=2049305 RepID=UPI00115C7704|nr:hypothetical protein [Changchengzhania lutea]
MKSIFTTLKKFWWLIIAIPLVLALIPLTKKILKGKGTDDTADANKVMDKIGVNASSRAELNRKAVELSHHLGTSYGWFDPRRWSENDKEAFEVLQYVTQKEFDIIARLYFEVYAKGRTLLNDLAKFLDKKYYSKLNFR